MAVENSRRKERIVWVDFLRAVAIAIIVLFHLALELDKDPTLRPIGFVGVSLFFIISGFVLARSYPALEKFDWKWLTSRYLRVVSLYYPTLIAISVLFGTQYSGGMKDIILHMLFLNWTSPETAYSIISSAWFIIPLMVFYIIFPFVNSWLKKYPATLPLFFFLSAISRYAEGIGTPFSPFFFIAEFSFGIALAHGKTPPILLLAPLLLVPVSLFMIVPFIVFWVSSVFSQQLSQITAPFAPIGRYTFEIFLFHEAVMMAALGGWNVYGQSPPVSLAITFVTFALVMVFSAYISRILHNFCILK